jgi:GTP-binding protein LepA
VRKEIEEIIGLDGSEAVLASAKEGKGIDEVLEGIIRVIPSEGRCASATQSLVVRQLV